MAGSLVPHGIQRLRQCVFFFDTGDSVRHIWIGANVGKTGPEMGMGKNQGVAVL